MNIKDYIKWLQTLPPTIEVLTDVMRGMAEDKAIYIAIITLEEIPSSPIDDILSGKVEAFEEA